jgi:hypothetical protein
MLKNQEANVCKITKLDEISETWKQVELKLI